LSLVSPMKPLRLIKICLNEKFSKYIYYLLLLFYSTLFNTNSYSIVACICITDIN
jgi:hypothetical protein